MPVTSTTDVAQISVAARPPVAPGTPSRCRRGATKRGVSSVAVGERYVWAATPRDNALWRIDPKTDGVTRIAMPHPPTGVTTGAGAVSVTIDEAYARADSEAVAGGSIGTRAVARRLVARSNQPSCRDEALGRSRRLGLLGCERAQDRVDELVVVLGVERCAAKQEPVVERADQELMRNPDVGVGPKSPRAILRSTTVFSSERRTSMIRSR
jgi:hypothetical protein